MAAFQVAEAVTCTHIRVGLGLVENFEKKSVVLAIKRFAAENEAYRKFSSIAYLRYLVGCKRSTIICITILAASIDLFKMSDLREMPDLEAY